jgi:hypothetical protein
VPGQSVVYNGGPHPNYSFYAQVEVLAEGEEFYKQVETKPGNKEGQLKWASQEILNRMSFIRHVKEFILVRSLSFNLTLNKTCQAHN